MDEYSLELHSSVIAKFGKTSTWSLAKLDKDGLKQLQSGFVDCLTLGTKHFQEDL